MLVQLPGSCFGKGEHESLAAAPIGAAPTFRNSLPREPSGMNSSLGMRPLPFHKQTKDVTYTGSGCGGIRRYFDAIKHVLQAFLVLLSHLLL
jgi:hypothetical protein